MTAGSQREQAGDWRGVHRQVEGTLRNKRAADVFLLKQQRIKGHSQLDHGLCVCLHVCACVRSYVHIYVYTYKLNLNGLRAQSDH